MDHCNDTENDIMHSILCVKLEPFDEDEDCTQNLDPLEPDGEVHTKVELLQDFKTEIESDRSDQATNELIQEDILKNDQCDTETKIEEINIKTEYIGNEASLDDVLASHRITEDSSPQNQLGENGSSRHTEHRCVEINKQNGEQNTTRKRYKLSHSCMPHRSEVINEEPTKDTNIVNVTSTANHSRARSDPCSSGVHIGIHKHSSSEKEGSKQSSLIAHSLLHPSYICDVCNMKFKNSRNLVKHKVVHTDHKPYGCDVCEKGFDNASSLVRHKRVHTGEKPYACDICKKGFSRSFYLATHKRIHTGEKPYVCDVCKKEFNQSSGLIRHKRIHTDEKPYVCNICEKEFSQYSNLVKHKRIHTGEKPYICNICQKGFSCSSSLVTHTRFHNGEKPHVCDICNIGFSESNSLVKHKRIHTGEKPYVCNICEKRFSQSSNLFKHKRIHTGEKPYVCKLCTKGFSQSSNLFKHKCIHTGQKS